jgi:hypothetical protein
MAMASIMGGDYTKLPKFVQDAYQQSIGQASNIANRPVNVGAMSPGFDPYQSGAAGILTQGLGSYMPYIEKAAQYAGPQGASAFMNPYTQNVVQNTVTDLNKQFGLQQAQANQRAIQSGSFAGSGTRGAVFDAALQGEQANTMRNTIGDLYNRGFQQSQQAAQNASGLMAGLGSQLQTQRLGDVNALFNLGQTRRGYDAERARLGYQLPMNQASFLQQATTGMPMFQQANMPSPFLGGLAGAGIAGSMMR